MHLRLMLMTLIVIFAICLSSAGKVKAQADKEMANSIGMKLVLIPKGTFQMGSPPSEENSRDNEIQRDNKRQHEVTLTRDYYLGAFEVTQVQYEKVMGKNPSYFQGDNVAERHPQTGQRIKEVDSSNHPVEAVSWEDAVEFCLRLSELPEEKSAGRVYRLPTEAEWEYACRAGSTTAFSFGDEPDSLDDYAWFSNNSDFKTHPVGEKKPNAWGLYDMHGNVLEWCSDRYAEYPKDTVSDPSGPREGVIRVNRGGSWLNEAAFCRSSRRGKFHPANRSGDFGFRVALSPSEIPK